MVINKFHVAWVLPRYNGILASDPAAFSGVVFSVEFGTVLKVPHLLPTAGYL